MLLRNVGWLSRHYRALHPKNTALQEALTSHVLSCIVGMRGEGRDKHQDFRRTGTNIKKFNKFPHGLLLWAVGSVEIRLHTSELYTLEMQVDTRWCDAAKCDIGKTVSHWHHCCGIYKKKSNLTEFLLFSLVPPRECMIVACNQLTTTFVRFFFISPSNQLQVKYCCDNKTPLRKL
jgi:hypothetical protein